MQTFTKTTLTALEKMPDPISLGPRHKPVRHDVLTRAMVAAFKNRGLKVESYDLKIKPPTPSRIKGVQITPGLENGILMADIRFDEKSLPAEMKMPLLQATATAHLLHANDQTLPVSLCEKQWIQICTNGMMGWREVPIMRRKHTTFIDVEQEAADAAEEWAIRIVKLNQLAERMDAVKLDQRDAESVLYRAFTVGKVAPPQYLPEVHDTFFNPAEGADDVAFRSLFGVHNAFTRVARGMSEFPRRTTEMNVTKFAESIVGSED